MFDLTEHDDDDASDDDGSVFGSDDETPEYVPCCVLTSLVLDLYLTRILGATVNLCLFGVPPPPLLWIRALQADSQMCAFLCVDIVSLFEKI